MIYMGADRQLTNKHFARNYMKEKASYNEGGGLLGVWSRKAASCVSDIRADS